MEGMELQLGLALPNANTAADHDQTSDGHHRIDLDLDLNVGIGGGYYGCGSEIHLYGQFQDVDGRVPEDRTRQMVPRTLPLLHWASREGNGFDDDEYMDTDSSSYHQPNRGRATLSGDSNYVKVAIEGIGIGRKVDLSLHHSFHALKDTLLSMFGINNEDSDNYMLAYQDRGGHWVIAEDSSWRNFIRSAQRLKMVRI